MAEWVDYLVFDILGDLCFGEKFDTKELGENKLETLPHLVMKQATIGYMVSTSGLIDLVLFLQPRGLNKLQERIRHADVTQYNQWLLTTLSKAVSTSALQRMQRANQLPDKTCFTSSWQPKISRPARCVRRPQSLARRSPSP
jgi:hypothetical protein